jgi:hypothetical protein
MSEVKFSLFWSFYYFGTNWEVAYRLDLPASSHIHPVVHVSLLKAAIKPDVEVSPELPLQEAEVESGVQPELILRRNLIKRGKATVPYVLIKWTGMPTELATWENLRQLESRFPQAPAWGQAGS